MAIFTSNLMASPVETLRAVGERAKRLRLVANLPQAALARQAGVGLATLQRFEATGKVSLENALRIAIALRAERDFEQLFAPPPATTLDEAMRPEKPLRQRARGRK